MSSDAITLSDIPLKIRECYHCGEAVVEAKRLGSAYHLMLNGKLECFCCPACYAVANAISAGGLSQFYQYRDKKSKKPHQSKNVYSGYDLDDVQIEFVEQVVNDVDFFQAQLLIPNISCAACAWLIENYLSENPYIEKVAVNVSNHQCRIVWNKSQYKLSDIFSALNSIGYTAVPATNKLLTQSRKDSSRSLLLRLGLAGIGMMQVGMVAVALHAGDLQGMDAHWRHYLRWVSLVFAIPILAYSAQPFFISAFRALRLKSVNMDVPVAIALILAFSASVWATVFHMGEVYFDSISMFIFFLLIGRYLELRARNNESDLCEDLTRLLPSTVNKKRGVENEVVPLKSLKVNDVIEVNAGSIFPCDGVVLDGVSSSDESILTGESMPVVKRKGDNILAGSFNVSALITLMVTATGDFTRLNLIQKMSQIALEEKPKYQTLANRLAFWFVIFVLLIASSNYFIWLYFDSSRAFWVTLSVLVVTCPCALSLATPSALTAAIQRMRSMGLLVTSSQFLERIQSVTHVVFDKTGTLTTGEIKISEVQLLTFPNGSTTYSSSDVLKIIAALESKSFHPIAYAFKKLQFQVSAESVSVSQGSGVEGVVDKIRYRFGKPKFAFAKEALLYPGGGLWQLLATEQSPIAWVLLEDQIKDSVAPLLKNLFVRGLHVSILSGDREVNVAALASAVGITDFTAEVKPENKLKYVQNLQKQGATVLMVGDGINDVPVLSGADVSIAMGSASQLTKISADSILLNNDVGIIIHALDLSLRLKSKIKQNFLWALFYNALALPLAVLGYIPPYIAAAGMSLSSFIVVVNSLRLRNIVLSKN